MANHNLPGTILPNIRHTAEPISYLTRFYIFEDTTSQPILLSSAACDWLGIFKLKLPNEVSLTHTDLLKVKPQNTSLQDYYNTT